MLPADDEAAAGRAAERFAEPRAKHYWDGDRHLARRLGQALALPNPAGPGGYGTAWDVYLAYGRGEQVIERPQFWMHQLDLTHAPRLDPAEWGRQVEGLLRTA